MVRVSGAPVGVCYVSCNKELCCYLGQGVLWQLHRGKDVSFCRNIVDRPPCSGHLHAQTWQTTSDYTKQQNITEYALDESPTATAPSRSKQTITYLDKHILILHHQGIGVNVSGEWFALVGVCAVLQLAGDVQRLCSHTHRDTQRHAHTRQAVASDMVLADEERQPSPTAKCSLLALCQWSGPAKRWQMNREADCFPCLQSRLCGPTACPPTPASAKNLSAPSIQAWSMVMVSGCVTVTLCRGCVWLAYLCHIRLKQKPKKKKIDGRVETKRNR